MTASRPRSKSGPRGGNRSKSRSKSQQGRDSTDAAAPVSVSTDAADVPPVPAVVDARPAPVIRDPATHVPIAPPAVPRTGEDDPVTLAQRAIAANNKSKAIPILPKSPAKNIIPHPTPVASSAASAASAAAAAPAAIAQPAAAEPEQQSHQPEEPQAAQDEEVEIEITASAPVSSANIADDDASVPRYTADILMSLNVSTLPTPPTFSTEVRIFTRADDPNAGSHSGGGHGGRRGGRGGHRGGHRGGDREGGNDRRNNDRRHRGSTHEGGAAPGDNKAEGAKDHGKGGAAAAEGEWPRGNNADVRNSPRASTRGSARNNSNDVGGDQSPGMSSRGGSRRGQQGARGVELLPEDLKPLEKSETAWVPEMRADVDKKAADASESDDVDEDTYRALMVKQVRGLLNKLSPENFDKLKDKFLFSCKHFSAMTAVCELLVRKSYDEPKYASLYAKLTHYFYTNLPLPPGIQDTPEQRREYSSTVRRFIIVACQNQFLARPDWAEKAAGKITEEEYEEVVKIKSKALGNMKFVGELYVSGIINPKVMILIVSSLISEKPAPAPAAKPEGDADAETEAVEQEQPAHDPLAHLTNPKEEDIECVLMLLNTMGPQADSILGTALCDPWYEILTEIYHRSSLISRIKFAIADLLDLRAARWARQWVQPGQGLDVRGKQVMAFSAEEKISSMSRQSSARGSTRGGPSRQNSMAGADAGNDGWSPANSSSGRRRDPSRFNSAGSANAGQQAAGDRRRGKSPSARGAGSRSNTAESASGASGKFAAAGPKSGSGSFRSQSGAGNNAGRRNNSESNKPVPQQQQQQQRRQAAPAAAAQASAAKKKPVNVFDLLHDVGEQESSEEEAEEEQEESEEADEDKPKVAQELTADPEEATPAVAAPVELSDDEIDTKAKAVMRNLFSSREASEWVDDVKKVAHYAKQLVAKSIDVMSQEKVAEATLFGKSLALGVQEGVFSLDELVQYIVEAEVVEFYADVKTDVPQLDSLMVAMLKEVAKAGDAAAVEPVLKATGIAEL